MRKTIKHAFSMFYTLIKHGFLTNQSYACARVKLITVWVVSKNESNCLIENKMVSTLIWRRVGLLLFIQSNINFMTYYLAI